MELIATARFKQAMDRAHAATAYTDRITKVVTDLAQAGLEFSHPLLEAHDPCDTATLLVLSANRGLCGGYNGNILRCALQRWRDLQQQVPTCHREVSGKRGLTFFGHRNVQVDETFTHFEDKPLFDEVEVLANRYLDAYINGRPGPPGRGLHTICHQRTASGRRRNPVAAGTTCRGRGRRGQPAKAAKRCSSSYRRPRASWREVVPTSFKVRLFKCFLDAAVSEQIARMIAMKSATENADDLIRNLSRTYNRARQSQITSELLDVMGGVEALKD